MFHVISKNIIAIKGTPLINEELFQQIQERLQKGLHTDPRSPGVHPLDSTQKYYDSGKPRGVFIGDEATGGPGLGSNDRAVNPGVGMGLGRDKKESKDPRNLSSGYNDGSRVDDETGPGHKSTIGPDGENPNPYEPVDTNPVMLDFKLKGQIGGDLDSQQVHQVGGNKEDIQRHTRDMLNGQYVKVPRKKANRF